MMYNLFRKKLSSQLVVHTDTMKRSISIQIPACIRSNQITILAICSNTKQNITRTVKRPAYELRPGFHLGWCYLDSAAVCKFTYCFDEYSEVCCNFSQLFTIT